MVLYKMVLCEMVLWMGDKIGKNTFICVFSVFSIEFIKGNACNVMQNWNIERKNLSALYNPAEDMFYFTQTMSPEANDAYLLSERRVTFAFSMGISSPWIQN